ncbi:hypothetical protein VNO78_16923 [Psophocarpus tetragonolobus]|uniref:Uncharacterized protein n=1 Tax=Psophocarpus tetragonolobus TaxID=3891 RepID=A0AAN9XKE6_PSOTE
MCGYFLFLQDLASFADMDLSPFQMKLFRGSQSYLSQFHTHNYKKSTKLVPSTKSAGHHMLRLKGICFHSPRFNLRV